MDSKPKLRAMERLQGPWVLSRTGVMMMLFVVLGPFGLGFLYKSKRFSRNAKIFLTIGVLVYTGTIIVIFAILIMYIYHQIAQFLSVS